MKYYLGPWREDPTQPGNWILPRGAVGGIDLRSEPDKEFSGVSVFSVEDASEIQEGPYVALGQGTYGAVEPSRLAINAWRVAFRWKPREPALVDWVWEALTDRADQTGINAPLPLTPDQDGVTRLEFPAEGVAKTRVPGSATVKPGDLE